MFVWYRRQQMPHHRDLYSFCRENKNADTIIYTSRISYHTNVKRHLKYDSSFFLDSMKTGNGFAWSKITNYLIDFQCSYLILS